MVLEKTLESPLDGKEVQPVHPKGDQSWVFIGRTDAEAETPILWPPHAKSWLIWKDPDAGRDWGQEEKGTTEDDGWMASLTQWAWVWVNSGSWWWTGRPGVLRFMGLQRVGHDWATELNWTSNSWLWPKHWEIEISLLCGSLFEFLIHLIWLSTPIIPPWRGLPSLPLSEMVFFFFVLFFCYFLSSFFFLHSNYLIKIYMVDFLCLPYWNVNSIMIGTLVLGKESWFFFPLVLGKIHILGICAIIICEMNKTWQLYHQFILPESCQTWYVKLSQHSLP